MQNKVKNKKPYKSQKLSKTKEQRLNELIKDIKQARKDHKAGILFKGTAKQVIKHLDNL